MSTTRHEIEAQKKHKLNEALIEAAKAGDLKTLEDSIQEGADLRYKDGTTSDALNYAIFRNHLSIVKCLLQTDTTLISRKLVSWGDTPLLAAAELGHTLMVEYLLENKADMSEKTILGDSPLLQAVREGGHISTVKLLLQKKADISEQSKSSLSDGNTALHVAIRDKNIALVRLLTERGADLNLPNKKEKTPMQLGLASDDFDIRTHFDDIQRKKEVKEAKEARESIENQLKAALTEVQRLRKENERLAAELESFKSRMMARGDSKTSQDIPAIQTENETNVKNPGTVLHQFNVKTETRISLEETLREAATDPKKNDNDFILSSLM